MFNKIRSAMGSVLSSVMQRSVFGDAIEPEVRGLNNNSLAKFYRERSRMVHQSAWWTPKVDKKGKPFMQYHCETLHEGRNAYKRRVRAAGFKSVQQYERSEQCGAYA